MFLTKREPLKSGVALSCSLTYFVYPMVLDPRCAGEISIIEMLVLHITRMMGEGENEQYNIKVVNQE